MTLNLRCVEKKSAKEGSRSKPIIGVFSHLSLRALDELDGQELVAGKTAAASTLGPTASIQEAQAQPAPSGQRPNIIVIMGDDIGWSNIGVYNQGIMAGRTPNLDRMASEGMRFTDYYAEASV